MCINQISIDHSFLQIFCIIFVQTFSRSSLIRLDEWFFQNNQESFSKMTTLSLMKNLSRSFFLHLYERKNRQNVLDYFLIFTFRGKELYRAVLFSIFNHPRFCRSIDTGDIHIFLPFPSSKIYRCYGERKENRCISFQIPDRINYKLESYMSDRSGFVFLERLWLARETRSPNN